MKISELPAGRRFQAEIKCESVRKYETEWGEKAIVRMITPENEVLIWFSREPIWIKEGDIAKVKATLKKFSVFSGRLQAEVSRVVPA